MALISATITTDRSREAELLARCLRLEQANHRLLDIGMLLRQRIKELNGVLAVKRHQNPAIDAAIVRLRDQERLTYRVIGAQLGMAETTVRVRYQRIKADESR